MGRVEAEFLPTVLQRNAAVGQHNAGAEAVIVALDKRATILPSASAVARYTRAAGVGGRRVWAAAPAR